MLKPSSLHLINTMAQSLNKNVGIQRIFTKKHMLVINNVLKNIKSQALVCLASIFKTVVLWRMHLLSTKREDYH